MANWMVYQWRRKKFRWCDKINDCPDIEVEIDCEYFKPKTNADRIRSMTDEELANKMKHSCPPDVACTYENECVECWINWLKQTEDED